MKNLIQKAIQKAIEAHKGQVRKGDGKTPYFLHPIEVGIIISRYTVDEDLICGAILHDVIEDGKVKIDDIKEEFNEAVALFVGLLTEDKTIKDWADRKTENLGRLKNYTGVYAIKAVDALVNMRDLFDLIQSEGENVWDKFNAPKDLEMKYFKMILDDTKNDMPSTLLENYVSAFKDLEYSHLLAENRTKIGFGAEKKA